MGCDWSNEMREGQGNKIKSRTDPLSLAAPGKPCPSTAKASKKTDTMDADLPPIFGESSKSR